MGLKRKLFFPGFVMTIAMIYLLAPMAALWIYSLATGWENTLLPEGWTLRWFCDMLRDPRFLDALLRSVFVSSVSVFISLGVMLLTMFTIIHYAPRWKRLLNALSVIPFAVPGVILALGLTRAYSSGPLALSGTVWLLIGAYCIVILPYMYQGIDSSLQTVNAAQLTAAAELLGASKWAAYWRVVVPNIASGILAATLLSFSVLFGEFVLSNLLVGARFETIQVYLYYRLKESGHLASAVAASYFVAVLLLSGIVLKLSKWVVRRS